MAYHSSSHSPEARLESFRFTVTDMKFRPAKKSAVLFRPRSETVSVLSRNYSASQQCLHRAICYRRDRQKKEMRLQGNRKVIDLQQVAMQVKAPMFMPSAGRLSSYHRAQFPSEKLVSEVVRASGQSPVRPHTQKRLPHIKFDVDFRRTRVKVAREKQEVKSPMELLTRKLQWEGKPVRKLVQYVKEESPARFVTTGKIHKAIERAACIRLSGWELQYSHELGAVEF